MTLDLARPEGQDALRRLVATADFFLESETPGSLAALGLGYAELQKLTPRLIHVSITPFGSTGPKAAWQESDLILWAAGGPLHPSRDGSRPPLRISLP